MRTFELCEDGGGVLDEQLALGCEAETAPVGFEEAGPGLAFEHAQLLGHRGRAERQGVGDGRDRAPTR